MPGSFSAGASWRNISTPLSEQYRVVTTSLSGYGGTQELRRPSGAFIEDEMDVLNAVIERAASKVHIVAHSFGGLLALFLVMQGRPDILSLTLLEPTAFSLLEPAGEAELNEQLHAMKDAYFSAWRSGDPQAVRHLLDFYGGAGTFDTYPGPVREKLMAQTSTNILDWETGDAVSLTMQELAVVTVPTLVVCGSVSHPAMQRCNQLLTQWMTQAKLQALEGANHFMIVTHPVELARVIDKHIRSTDAL